ncbi:helix-turn-helix transcriptional regulator [Tahibacter sp. BL]|uniref:Helix-turn-helix transcriptional regulator n=2 Tax=Tahibacter soli TaxID=2983605 RepID=A0A9X3YP70_9GAMM|nr:helix-turn-helix transcriptional regulator [Tahibacter soli]MDC8015849.1 helix-turn-helix transcriptional regulator [Tahibacter soli]
MKRFGDRLREARTAAGMTQEQLGFELGVTKSSVSAWENGRETPGFRLLEALRQALGRSLDELICDAPAAAETGVSKDTTDTDAASVARNPDERALLARYRRLPARKRGALLELIRRE